MDVPRALSVWDRLTIFFGTRKVSRMDGEIIRLSNVIVNIVPAIDWARQIVKDMCPYLDRLESLVEEFDSAGPDQKLLLIFQIEKEEKDLKQFEADLEMALSMAKKRLEE